MKKASDIEKSEDLAIGVMNLISIEEHLFFTEAKTKKILGEQSVTGLVYEKKGKEKTIKVQGVIIEIGRVPNTEFCKGFVDLDEHTHIKIDEQTRTSVPGVFAAGDCASGHEYQYVIAAGQGCIALLKAARFLANQKA